MSDNKVIKSVSFNLKNVEDDEILKAIERKNFSGYVKDLILRDIRNQETAPAEEKKELSAKERIEVLKQQKAANSGRM